MKLKKYLYVVGACASIFFLVGVIWGSMRQQIRSVQLAKRSAIRVLCPEKWLDQTALEEFSDQHNVRIDAFTYSNSSDFLRQMANSGGKVDVICTSSFLVKSLIQNRWLKKVDYSALPNMKQIAVDFSSLPYDPNSEYTVPLFWSLYGFFGKGELPEQTSWRQTWQSQKLSLWGEMLNVLNLMNSLDLNASERLIDEERLESIGLAFKKFSKGTIEFLRPGVKAFSAEAMMAEADWVQIPLARVARLLESDSPYRFWLPEDGAAIEIGVLSIGEKAEHPELALKLIDDLISTPHAMQSHKQMDMGTVHSSLNEVTSIARLQKPEALREFPLNKLNFPDIDIQDLPRFQKLFDEVKQK